jgi:hypothetical protein
MTCRIGVQGPGTLPLKRPELKISPDADKAQGDVMQ